MKLFRYQQKRFRLSFLRDILFNVIIYMFFKIMWKYCILCKKTYASTCISLQLHSLNKWYDFFFNLKIRRLDNQTWRKLRLLYFWHIYIMIRLQYRKRNYLFRNWRLVANRNAKVSGIWKIKRIYVTQIFKVRPVVRHADKICHNWTNELGCYKIPKTHVVCYCEQSQRRKKLILSPFKKSFISQTQ